MGRSPCSERALRRGRSGHLAMGQAKWRLGHPCSEVHNIDGATESLEAEMYNNGGTCMALVRVRAVQVRPGYRPRAAAWVPCKRCPHLAQQMAAH